MRYKKARLAVLCGALLFVANAQAAKLSILIDDFGYRQHNENQILEMPLAVSVAIFPNAPDSRIMMEKAHRQGREILIHLPMAPMSKQPLEKDTLTPSMSSEEVKRIVDQAIRNIPYAIGINNHMGSAMTSSLSGMQKVMQAMDKYDLFFLDSVTIGNTQAQKAAAGTRVKVIKRNVFLDDVQNEAEIRRQFERAIQIARSRGSAIAIGHPHPTTIRVLQQMLPKLPSDIVLVRPSDLLNEPLRNTTASDTTSAKIPTKTKPPIITSPKKTFKSIGLCVIEQPIPPVYADAMLKILGEGISSSPVITFIEHQWQNWFEKPVASATTDHQN